MIHYLDSSALVKRYVHESGSLRIRELFRKRSAIVVARVAYVEVSAAVMRRNRAGEISQEQADAIFLRLAADFRTMMTVVELRKSIVDEASDLVRKHPLRGYDAVQLASALSVASKGAVTFWCLDENLLAAAVVAGLRISKPS